MTSACSLNIMVDAMQFSFSFFSFCFKTEHSLPLVYCIAKENNGIVVNVFTFHLTAFRLKKSVMSTFH